MKGMETLCVAYGADDNYAKYLGISMQSLFETNKDFAGIDVFIMDCNIGSLNKEKLLSIAKRYNRNISFIAMNDYVSELKLNMGARKIAIASYARLFLSSVIPDTYTRVFYLDCDTIIVDSITEYWNMDLEGYFLAGVRDTVDKYFLKKIGLAPDAPYVNAGIILVNLIAWRAVDIQKKFMEFIRKLDGNVPHHDQGVINAICHDKIKIVSPIYNVSSNVFTFSAKTIKRIYFIKSFYSQKELDEAKTKPVIIHYTTGLVGRPWEENCTHPRKGEYLRVAMASPWKDDPILPDSRRFSVKAFSSLYRYAPGFITENIYKLQNWLTHFRK